METTYKKIFAFSAGASQFLATNKSDTLLAEALQDVAEQLPEIQEEYGKKVTRIRRAEAAEDKYGCLLRDDKGDYRFTKEGESKVEEQIEELNDELSQFDIDPVFVDVVPKSLDRRYIKAFVGFVFKADTPTEK